MATYKQLHGVMNVDLMHMIPFTISVVPIKN